MEGSTNFQIHTLLFACVHFSVAVKAIEISGLVTSGRRPDINAIKPDTPCEVTEMIQRCWQDDPNARPTSLGNTHSMADIIKIPFQTIQPNSMVLKIDSN